jgi:aminopeptidase N
MQSPAPIGTAGKDVLTADPGCNRAIAWAQLRARTRLDMAQVFRSPAYFVLLVLGLIHSVLGLHALNPMWGTSSLPVTRLMIDLLNGSFTLIPLIVAIYYSSELVWLERNHDIHEIIGASAIPDWAYALPKTLAVALVLVSTLLVGLVAAIAIQTFHAYTNFEIDKYLLWYVLPNTADYVLIGILAVFVQVISPHKFVGWGIMLLFVVSRSVLPQLGLDDHLYTYGQGPTVPLSDMNGQGHFWIGAWSFRAYWAAFALLLLVLSHVLWRRGAETRLLPRLKRLPRLLNGPAGGIAVVATLAFAGLGTWCFINTHVWNDYRTPGAHERYLSDYERQLLPYERALQPVVTAVRVKADLWPDQRKLVTSGTLELMNRQAVPLSEVHLRMRSRDTDWTALTVSGATLVKAYPAFQYRIYRFATPLAPGAVARVAFTTVRHQIGFRNDGNDVAVVGNGTFVESLEVLPAVGMNRHRLLSDPAKRRKYGLPAELRAAKLEDLSATGFSQLRGDWVKTDIALTTDADQTPVAPGLKVADSIRDGRRTARFVSELPIQNFFSLQSARYQERRVQHGGVELAVYYDAQHPRNVERMLAASARAIDVYRAAFGPYQFRHARIVEFPAYRTAAQSFAGTFPYSEGFGFIADLSDQSRLDVISQIVAHELAHQWWGNQVSSADMQGGTMLTETLAQYAALMVMEKTTGRDDVRRYLKHELNTYLASRGSEAVEELPLVRVENQPYIHYQKGELAMYRLKDVLGEVRVNAALRRYIDRFRFRSAPYPRSLDLIAEFRKGASAAENRLITDLFEKITLYDIKTKAARVRMMPDGRYETTLIVEAHKYHADGSGRETEVPLAESIDYGLFTTAPGWGPLHAIDVLALQRMDVRTGTQQIKLMTAAKPAYAGADPYNLLVDRNSDDNVTSVGR